MPRSKKEIKELVDHTLASWQALKKSGDAVYTGDGRKLPGVPKAYYGATSAELKSRAVLLVHHCLDHEVTG